MYPSSGFTIPATSLFNAFGSLHIRRRRLYQLFDTKFRPYWCPCTRVVCMRRSICAPSDLFSFPMFLGQGKCQEFLVIRPPYHQTYYTHLTIDHTSQYSATQGATSSCILIRFLCIKRQVSLCSLLVGLVLQVVSHRAYDLHAGQLCIADGLRNGHCGPVAEIHR